ncbi:MAG: glycosyltransferase family 2 protein [Caldilineaceae bacterium]|nr:glycosyltransferase family 2 protein [Caldilineaceae bacterium]
MMNPIDVQFSVVIPTYNRSHLVGRAIESALQQTKAAVEIIVVDDGSADETAQVVQAFGDRVRYVHQQNAGSARARDNGIRRAQAPWVALLDSDDAWVPAHLERMANAIAGTAGQANFYFADTVEPPEKGGGDLWQVLGFQIEGPYQLVADGTAWVVCDGRQPMMLQSSVFKRSAYLAVGGFHPELRYRDDTHLFMKLGINGPVCAVAGCGVEMNGDDVPENRLTLTYNVNRRLGSGMQIVMYRDLLTTIHPLSNELRRRFVSRLATAHRSMARAAWKEGQWREALRHIRQSFVVSPSESLRHLPSALLHPGKS